MSIFSDQSLLVSYHFLVAFLTPQFNLLYPPDIRFQKVRGLKVKIEMENINQGGDNDAVYGRPVKTTYDNLILEKGRTRSSINFSISNMFSSYILDPVDILIIAMNIKGGVMSAWVVQDAYPISWSVSDLDANSNTVIIDTLELTYKRLNSIII